MMKGTVSWEDVSTPLCKVSFYTVRIRRFGSTPFRRFELPSKTFPGDTHSCEFTNLDPEFKYQTKVIAIGENGNKKSLSRTWKTLVVDKFTPDKVRIKEIKIHDEPYEDTAQRGVDFQPKIEVSPSKLEFSDLKKEGKATLNLNISNKGTSYLTVHNMVSNKGTTVFKYTPLASMGLSPSQTVAVPFSFEANEYGEYSDIIDITSDDPANPLISVEVTGNCPMPKPEIEIISNPMEFGEVPIAGDTKKKLIIRNKGAGALIITKFGRPNNDGKFEWNESGVTVNPGKYQELEIKFDPDKVKDYEETMLMLTNVMGDEVIPVTLKGTGVKKTGEIEVKPNPLEFSQVALGEKIYKTITVTNISKTEKLEISNIEPRDTISPLQIDGTFTYPIQVDPGDNISINIVYAPLNEGDHENSVKIKSNDPNNPIVHAICTGVGVKKIGQMEVEPNPLDYGQVGLGKNIHKSIRITNKSQTDQLVITEIVQRDTISPFQINARMTFPIIINPLDDFTVDVVYSPTTKNQHKNEIKIKSNDPNNPVEHVKCIGKGIEITNKGIIKVKPPSHDFETYDLKDNQFEFIVSNVGKESFLISDIQRKVGPFNVIAAEKYYPPNGFKPLMANLQPSYNNDPNWHPFTDGSIDKNEKIRVIVEFAPTTNKPKTYREQIITIENNASNSEGGIITLSGSTSEKSISIASIEPSSGVQGMEYKDVVVRGSGFHDKMKINFKGSDIKISDFKLIDEDAFSCTLTIDKNAKTDAPKRLMIKDTDTSVLSDPLFKVDVPKFKYSTNNSQRVFKENEEYTIYIDPVNNFKFNDDQRKARITLYKLKSDRYGRKINDALKSVPIDFDMDPAGVTSTKEQAHIKITLTDKKLKEGDIIYADGSYNIGYGCMKDSDRQYLGVFRRGDNHLVLTPKINPINIGTEQTITAEIDRLEKDMLIQFDFVGGQNKDCRFVSNKIRKLLNKEVTIQIDTTKAKKGTCRVTAKVLNGQQKSFYDDALEAECEFEIQKRSKFKVTDCDPHQGKQGEEIVGFKIKGEGFNNSCQVSFDVDDKIKVENIVANSTGTEIVCDIKIAKDAATTPPKGPRRITVQDNANSATSVPLFSVVPKDKIKALQIPRLNTLLYADSPTTIVAMAEKETDGVAKVDRNASLRVVGGAVLRLKNNIGKCKTGFLKHYLNQVKLDKNDIEKLANEYYHSKPFGKRRAKLRDLKPHVTRMGGMGLADFGFNNTGFFKNAALQQIISQNPFANSYYRLKMEWDKNSKFVAGLMKKLHKASANDQKLTDLFEKLGGVKSANDTYEWNGFTNTEHIEKLQKWYLPMIEKTQRKDIKIRFNQVFEYWQKDWDRFVLCTRAINLIISKINKELRDRVK